MMRALRTGLIVTAILAASPALAQGLAGSTVGLTASGLPSDPFASNYPSEPPPQVLPDRRQDAVRRRVPTRRGIAAPRSAQRLTPPANVTGGRPRR